MTGPEFRRLRERLGLTRQQLAARMGTTTASVSRWESPDPRRSRPISELVARYLKLLVRTEGKRTGGR
jgi:DNA-binding transcriptional regulator YiaG